MASKCWNDRLLNNHSLTANDIQIVAPLRMVADGWPPFASEILKVIDLGNSFRIDCIPWFTYGLNRSDIIVADMKNGSLVFREVIASSGHSTFRIRLDIDKIRDPSRNEFLPEFIVLTEALGKFNCTFEESSTTLHSIDVPPHPETNVRAIVKDLLSVGEEAGWFEWEEGTYPKKAVHRRR